LPIAFGNEQKGSDPEAERMAQKLNVAGQEANRHRVLRNGISDLLSLSSASISTSNRGYRTRGPPPRLGNDSHGRLSNANYNVGPSPELTRSANNTRGGFSGSGSGSMRGNHHGGAPRSAVDMNMQILDNPGDQRHRNYDREAVLDRRPSRGRGSCISRGRYNTYPRPVASSLMAKDKILDYGPPMPSSIPARAVRSAQSTPASAIQTSRYASNPLIKKGPPPQQSGQAGILTAIPNLTENSKPEPSKLHASDGASRFSKSSVPNTVALLVDQKSFMGHANQHVLSLKHSCRASNRQLSQSTPGAIPVTPSVISTTHGTGQSRFSTANTSVSTPHGNGHSKSHSSRSYGTDLCKALLKLIFPRRYFLRLASMILLEFRLRTLLLMVMFKVSDFSLVSN
jgi:hypothetical protein